MKLNLTKFAMIGACVFGVALHSGTASAQPVTFNPGAPEIIPVTATVSNSITADVTAPTFGQLGVIRSNTAADIATVTISPAGGITTVAGPTTARIVTGGGHAAGIVAITGAFPNTAVNVTYSAPVNLNCGACSPGTPTLDIEHITDNLTSAGVLDVATPANNAVGTGTIGAGGDLTFNVGLRLATSVGATPYETGAYAGSFSAMIQY